MATHLKPQTTKNISVGLGTVVHAGNQGWALPGGIFTHCPATAEKIAEAIDRELRLKFKNRTELFGYRRGKTVNST